MAYTESNPNTDLARLRDPDDGYADEAHALRTQYSADLVVLLLGESSSNVGGAGYIINNEYGNPKAGFAVVKEKWIAANYTLIHEIGHNFGCGHHVNTDTEALYYYAHGYGLSSDNFSTIMTYENLNFGTRIPYFSDPNILHNGVAIGAADANNAKTIRQTKGVIASYSNEIIYTDAFLKDITLSSGTLAPAFNPGVYQYTVNVSDSVTSIDVQGIANSPHAAVTGNVTAQPLAMGSNTVVIEVEDAWGNYQKKTYTITVIREAANSNGNTENPSTAVATQSIAALLIYPNPIGGQLTVTGDRWNAGDKVDIYNAAGAKVFETSLSGVHYPLSIDIAHLPAGVYIVKAGNRVGKVVKQ